MWVFFTTSETVLRTIRQGDKKEAPWYHYFKENGTVPVLKNLNFEYDASLPKGVAGKYIPESDTLVLGFSAAMPATKPVFGVDATGKHYYREEHYSSDNKYEAAGVHAVTKNCWHEYWHRTLIKETYPNKSPYYGLGYQDDDGDELSNDPRANREAELGTKPKKKDTYGLSKYKGIEGNSNYSGYAGYADAELYCRWKEITYQGDNSKDWSQHRLNREHLANQPKQ